MAMKVWSTVMLTIAVAGCSGDGPPRDQIRADLTKALPGRLMSACGLLGTEELKVRAIKIESVGDDGSGVASADVTNSHTLFGNPPSDCTVRVAFRTDKYGESWVLKDLKELR